MKRREFLGRSILLTTASVIPNVGCSNHRHTSSATPPGYLKDYSIIYQTDPREAAREWFSQARYGLFIHYGLYSQLGRGEWVMFKDKIPVAEYKQLKSTFRPDKFDADFITDLACDAQMKYINITTRHHDGFCLFETATSDYHCVNSPAKRDLIAEMAKHCRKKGLGLFFYYSLAADWQHPYFYPRKHCFLAQPAYETPDPTYQWKTDEDFQKYMDYAHAQIDELLTHYGPIAGIWFDPLVGYYGRPDLFSMEKTYSRVRERQPQTLISFKQGATGTEDFASPERSGQSMEVQIRKQYGQKAAQIAAQAWDSNKNKHNEICDTLQKNAWGYEEGVKHKTAEQVLEMLTSAFKQKCNLLLNTGPLSDGSIHPEDITALRKAGEHLRVKGWPS